MTMSMSMSMIITNFTPKRFSAKCVALLFWNISADFSWFCGSAPFPWDISAGFSWFLFCTVGLRDRLTACFGHLLTLLCRYFFTVLLRYILTFLSVLFCAFFPRHVSTLLTWHRLTLRSGNLTTGFLGITLARLCGNRGTNLPGNTSTDLSGHHLAVLIVSRALLPRGLSTLLGGN